MSLSLYVVSRFFNKMKQLSLARLCFSDSWAYPLMKKTKQNNFEQKDIKFIFATSNEDVFFSIINDVSFLMK